MLSKVQKLLGSEKGSINEIWVGSSSQSLVSGFQGNGRSGPGEVVEESGEVSLELFKGTILERTAVGLIGDCAGSCESSIFFSGSDVTSVWHFWRIKLVMVTQVSMNMDHTNWLPINLNSAGSGD